MLQVRNFLAIAVKLMAQQWKGIDPSEEATSRVPNDLDFGKIVDVTNGAIETHISSSVWEVRSHSIRVSRR